MGIALCMIVKNEEDRIEAAVQSVRSIVSEVIIADTGSTAFTLSRVKPLAGEFLDWTMKGQLRTWM